MSARILQKLVCDPDSLTEEEFFQYLSCIENNDLSGPEVASFLTALSARPLDALSLVRFVRYINSHYPLKALPHENKLINIVGTGGGRQTFNISTTAAILASSAGAKVLKSGSYSYNSQSGSLDVLRSLGISATCDSDVIEFMLEKTGIAFLSADGYSPLLRRIAISILPIPFKHIGRFVNLAGPLLCPFSTSGQVTGVASNDVLYTLSQAMAELDRTNSIVVHADIGMDEFSSIGTNHYIYIDQRKNFHPLSCNNETFNFTGSNQSALDGSGPEHNARYTKKILSGEIEGAACETVLLNSAAVLLLAEEVNTLKEGVAISHEAIKSGIAEDHLKKVIKLSNSLGKGIA